LVQRLSTHAAYNEIPGGHPEPPRYHHGGPALEILIPVGLLVVWLALQLWVLPRFGVKT